MNPIVLYMCSKSISPYEKLGRTPLSTFLLMMCLTASNAHRQIYVRFFNSSIYSSSVLTSNAILARLIVFTFTEPTFNAVPPIELKSVILRFHIGLDYFLYAVAHTPISNYVSIVAVLLLARIVSTGSNCFFPLTFLNG